MPVSFDQVIASPGSGRRRALIFECHDYARAVILQGKAVPWEEPAAYANLLKQAYGMLRSDLAVVGIGHLYDDLRAGRPDLAAAMHQRSRVGFALRTLLGDPDAGGLASDVVAAVATTQRIPVAIHLPTPRRWLEATHPGDPADITDDHVENASMYIADRLRSFAGASVGLVVFDDRPGVGQTAGPRAPVDWAALSPVTNLAAHYDWAVGVWDGDGLRVADSATTVRSLEADFWRTDLPAPEGSDPLISTIPADAVPETVLAKIAGLVAG